MDINWANVPVGTRIKHTHRFSGEHQPRITYGCFLGLSNHGFVAVAPDPDCWNYGTPSIGGEWATAAYQFEKSQCTIAKELTPEEIQAAKYASVIKKSKQLEDRWKLQQEAKKASASVTAPARSVALGTTSHCTLTGTSGVSGVATTNLPQFDWVIYANQWTALWDNESSRIQMTPPPPSPPLPGNGLSNTELQTRRQQSLDARTLNRQVFFSSPRILDMWHVDSQETEQST